MATPMLMYGRKHQHGLNWITAIAMTGLLAPKTSICRPMLAAAHESFNKEVAGLLTADQATKFTALQEMRQSFRPEPPPPVQ